MTTEGHFVHPATTHTKAVDAILQIKIKLESEVRQFRDGEKLWWRTGIQILQIDNLRLSTVIHSVERTRRNK